MGCVTEQFRAEKRRRAYLIFITGYSRNWKYVLYQYQYVSNHCLAGSSLRQTINTCYNTVALSCPFEYLMLDDLQDFPFLTCGPSHALSQNARDSLFVLYERVLYVWVWLSRHCVAEIHVGATSHQHKCPVRASQHLHAHHHRLIPSAHNPSESIAPVYFSHPYSLRRTNYTLSTAMDSLPPDNSFPATVSAQTSKFTRVRPLHLCYPTGKLTLQQAYQTYLDKSVPFTAYRWGATGTMLLIFMARIVLAQGWYIGTLDPLLYEDA